jgi:hypothetical protein
VNETRRVAEHYAGRKYVFETSDLSSEEASSRHSHEGMGLDRMMTVWQSGHFQHGSHLHYRTNQMRTMSEVPRYLETNRLGSALVYCLDSPVKGTLVPLRIVGSFFEFVPARLGRNAALDDAVSCLSAIYCGAPSTPYSFHKGIYQSYVKALSSLRTCLSDNSLRMESETLCASVLLQMCEVSFVLAWQFSRAVAKCKLPY